MSPATRPTLAILAEKLGVTPATISVALRGKGRMREELRQKIIVLAMELGYRPNQAAKAMLEGQSRQIALVQGRADDRSTLPQNVLAGCVDRLTELGYQLTVLRLSDQELSSERKLPRFVQESHCDGMILNYTHDIPEQLLRILNQFHLPYVFFNTNLPEDTVRPDDRKAGRDATEVLLSAGHKRIAFIARTGHHYSSVERAEGYHHAMMEAGLAPWSMDTRFTLHAKERLILAKTFLASPNRPTALVCYNSIDAQIFTTAAIAAGLVVPRDLSVITFDDAPAYSTGFIMSSMLRDTNKLGRSVAEMCVERVNGAGHLPTRAVPFVFLAGESIAPPPHG